MVIGSFLFFLAVFVLIGASAMFRRTHTTTDYLVAGKTVPEWLAGLSAVATNNSGYMFVGMIGLTYSIGLSSIWLMIGWIIGDMIGSFLVLANVRRASEQEHVQSFAGLLGHWHGHDYRKLKLLAALLIIPFLGSYAAAQLSAGSKALHVLFGWNEATGAMIGSVMVLFYSFSGGIRASIWTDAAQSLVMLTAMVLLMTIGYQQFAGPRDLYGALAAVEPGYMNWFPDGGMLDKVLFVVGWLFGGFGVLGQPHIVIRFMAFRDPKRINHVRAYYYTWFTLFYGATIIVGLMARLLLPEVSDFDAELALPTLSMQLLPPILVGLTLAGLFAATMSTADSLILSCSAAITRDLLPEKHSTVWMSRMFTLFMVVVALGVAVTDNQTVFQLVLMAWGLLACAFAPLMVVYSLDRQPPEWLSMATMVAGVAVFLVWRFAGLGDLVYEIFPGIAGGLLFYFALAPFTGEHRRRHMNSEPLHGA